MSSLKDKIRTATGWMAKQTYPSMTAVAKEIPSSAKKVGKYIVTAPGKAAKIVGGAIKNSLKKTMDIEMQKEKNEKWQSDARKKVLEQNKGEADLNN